MSASIIHSKWDDILREEMNDDISRRVFTGERAMLAQIYLDKGAIVPTHSHESEQLSWVLEGALKFWIGEEGQEEVVVSAGEVLLIPSNVPHKAEALEYSVDIDVFSPPRQDWLDGTDTYFRKGQQRR